MQKIPRKLVGIFLLTTQLLYTSLNNTQEHLVDRCDKHSFLLQNTFSAIEIRRKILTTLMANTSHNCDLQMTLSSQQNLCKIWKKLATNAG